ncbi:MAG: hypothetical protein WAM70_19345, partial [Pyrinomonadaceae bacterium]
ELELSWQSRESDSKSRFVERALRETADDEIVRIGRWYVANRISTDEIEDLLEWIKSKGEQRLSDITRRAILEALEGQNLAGRVEIAELMKLAGTSLPRYDNGLSCVVQGETGLYTENLLSGFYGQASPRTPLSNKQFLKDSGFLTCVDSKAIRLLETLVHPSVREGAEQADWINLLLPILKSDGYIFQQRGAISGRAVFGLIRESDGVAGRPKNLIFASIGAKPELGFADAINNDVVLEHADSCLIYDWNLSDSGLLWSDLVKWWAALNDLDPASAQTRKSLGKRLQNSLGSDPEKLLFDTYFK